MSISSRSGALDHATDFVVCFDNADRDVQPLLLVDLSWEEVKVFFRAEARRLDELWLESGVERAQESEGKG